MAGTIWNVVKRGKLILLVKTGLFRCCELWIQSASKCQSALYKLYASYGVHSLTVDAGDVEALHNHSCLLCPPCVISTLPPSWILHSCLPLYPLVQYVCLRFLTCSPDWMVRVSGIAAIWPWIFYASCMDCPCNKKFLHSTCNLYKFFHSFWLLWSHFDLQSLPRSALRQVLCSANHFDVLHLLAFLKRSTQRHKLAEKDTFPSSTLSAQAHKL